MQCALSGRNIHAAKIKNRFGKLCSRKEKLEILQKEYTRIKEVLSEKDRMVLQEYVEQLKQVSFEEQQEAYCQGIIDTIQILAGVGLLPMNEDIQKLIEKMQ